MTEAKGQFFYLCEVNSFKNVWPSIQLSVVNRRALTFLLNNIILESKLTVVIQNCFIFILSVVVFQITLKVLAVESQHFIFNTNKTLRYHKQRPLHHLQNFKTLIKDIFLPLVSTLNVEHNIFQNDVFKLINTNSTRSLR